MNMLSPAMITIPPQSQMPLASSYAMSKAHYQARCFIMVSQGAAVAYCIFTVPQDAPCTHTTTMSNFPMVSSPREAVDSLLQFIENAQDPPSTLCLKLAITSLLREAPFTDLLSDYGYTIQKSTDVPLPDTLGPKQQRARLGIWTRNGLRGFPRVTRVTR
jgi:hypothetical protein